MSNLPDYDPLEEPAPPRKPRRDSKGRYLDSGNPKGRKWKPPHDPSLPASRRRIINQVADEMVEVKVNGKPRMMTLFEANVRALALDGIRHRVAAQRFIELATETSQVDLERRLIGHIHREMVDRLEQENEQLKRLYEPRSGVLEVPMDNLDHWPPEGLIDDEKRVNMAMVRDLRQRHGKKKAPDA